MAVVSKAKKINMGNVFVDNVLAMHREEIYGVKNCIGISWECIFKDFLIIKTLRTHSGDNLTQEDVECLYNKITNINK